MPVTPRQPRRVVVTGLGAVTPLGLTASETWQSLIAGRSGIGPITCFDTTDFPVRVAGEVKGFDPVARFGDKEARHLDRSAQFGLVAAEQALNDAKLGPAWPGSFVPERAGVMVGTGIGGIHALETNLRVMESRGYRRVSPFTIPMLIGNMVSGHISIRHGFKGPSICHISACATGSHAIGEALRTLMWGYADVVLAGGVEGAITKLTVTGFANCKALSTANDRGPAASRPFDRERDGFVMAEGGAVLVLETLAHATGRGARILAELVGYGATSDAYHITAPPEDGNGIIRAMQLAMEEAGVTASDLAYINAHGTSTPYNDRTETAAYKRAFGEHAYRVPISSTKSATGHLMGGAGSLEAMFCVQAIGSSVIPPTLNYEFPDPECDLDYVPNVARPAEVPVALTNSMGFGGHNATLIFRKFVP
ncbi:MAG: beta-ketoacyl-ACP synthase II [Candidatus Riflebacteria bacterium]|nr:beta-ketoacyl-ACP synthase II [Candidatus Riflebacteria bacterium]